MSRLIVGCGLAVLSTVVFAQPHVLPPGHIETYAGEAIVRAGISGGLNYAGVYLVDQRRWFVYQAETPIAFRELRTHAVVDYWHDGFRVTLPREQQTLIFRRSETPAPAGLSRSAFPATTYSTGYGVILRELGPAVNNANGANTIEGDYCSPENSSCGPFEDDPIDGGHGGSSCLPRSCSVGCGDASCSAACNTGFVATCSCNGSVSALCSCVPC